MKRSNTHLLSATLVLASLTLPAQAETVQYEDGYAVGIENLRVNNRCFDVSFETGSYNDVYGRSAPMFLDQPIAANAAANEIRDVLNAQRGVPEINASDGEALWLPNDSIHANRFRAEQVGHNQSTDPWQRYLDFEGIKNHDWEAYDFAVFTEGPEVVYADNTGHAVGINNLNIDGTCLDVRFARGSYEDVYGDRPPRYLGLEARGNNAANSMMNLLNAEPDVPEINASDNEVLWVPTDRDRGQFEAEQLGHNTSKLPWRRFGDFRGSMSASYDPWDFAVFDSSLDCNGDGVVDINDMNCSCTTGLGADVLAAMDTVAGDLDGNGRVAFSDFLKLSGNFGETGRYTDGDLDCDGRVGFADFLILSGNFGYGGPGTLLPEKLAIATPEPHGLCLATGIVPACLLFRRRRTP